MSTTWPPHDSRRVAWVPSGRRGSREDRLLAEIDVALPPLIAELTPQADPGLTAMLDDSSRRIVALDAAWGDRLPVVGRLLIRSEAVASSKIEYIEASIDDYARAVAGMRSNSSATSMVDATRALVAMIDDAGTTGAVTLEAVLGAHRLLLSDDPLDGAFAGRLRTMQNWIGGSDHSPRGAIHVPPPPETVPDYLADLLAFCNRVDLPPLVQAAVAHLQFESIHPFTDGNGRIGRALINAVLRRRGLTRSTVVPLASALLARRDDYFSAVNAYRDGDIDSFLTMVATGASIAVDEATVTARRLDAMPLDWQVRMRPRDGSSADMILAKLLDRPIFGVDDVVLRLGLSESAAYRGVEALVEAGILIEVTARKRNRVHAAVDVLDELGDLDARIAAASVA